MAGTRRRDSGAKGQIKSSELTCTVEMTMRYNTLALLLFVFTLAVGGCLSPSERSNTVGIRIFNEHPRFYDGDMVWIHLKRLDTGDFILRAPLPNGWHDPLEIHQLTKSQPLVLEIVYKGFSESDNKNVWKHFQRKLLMDDDIDIDVHWEPYIPPDGRAGEHMKRDPTVDITRGHPTLFD